MAELRKVLTRAGADRLDEAEAREMMEQADRDGNDVLDYSEFEQLWSQIRSDTAVRADCPVFTSRMQTDHIRMKRRSEKNFSNWIRIKAGS